MASTIGKRGLQLSNVPDKETQEAGARSGILVPSKHDPCLFLGNGLIVITYVDNIFIYRRDQKKIDNLIERLNKDSVHIRKEGITESYLGLSLYMMETRPPFLNQGLSNKGEGLGLSSKFLTPVSTPAEKAALPRDVDGKPATGCFNYPSIIGMLHYLNHTQPDCAFAIHQCALDKGITSDPSNDITTNCYPDADFAGLWGHEHPQDHHCGRSHTGYVIILAGCPVVWVSRLQTEIVLSTMEAEYVALSSSCKDLFPIMDISKITLDSMFVFMKIIITGFESRWNHAFGTAWGYFYKRVAQSYFQIPLKEIDVLVIYLKNSLHKNRRRDVV
ncbi:LOW QUALITY PROTEIN: hypothetical protein ACHAXR_002968 [Thalassiosira sp. AJA248-18]